MADDPSMAMYTSARSYYVHFPRLEPGDVVELQYRVEDVAPRNAFADYFGEVVYMQSGEPIARSEYVLMTPKSRTLLLQRAARPGPRARPWRSKGDTAHLPLRRARTCPPWSRSRCSRRGPRCSATCTCRPTSRGTTWALVLGPRKDQFVPTTRCAARAEALTKGLKDDRAKVRAIYDYVVQKTRYVALEFGIHGFKPYRCAQIFARGFGDCKDKATLIVTMLGALGIKATPVIVRTANKGDIETDARRASRRSIT